MGKTAVVVSDAHFNKNFPTSLSDEILKTIRSRSPSYIFMTGDIFDYANEPLEIKTRAKLFLQELSKISPVFMVLGNHDLASPVKGRKRSFSDEGYNFLKQVEKETENFHLLPENYHVKK